MGAAASVAENIPGHQTLQTDKPMIR
jgi:hypothetical protein